MSTLCARRGAPRLKHPAALTDNASVVMPCAPAMIMPARSRASAAFLDWTRQQDVRPRLVLVQERRPGAPGTGQRRYAKEYGGHGGAEPGRHDLAGRDDRLGAGVLGDRKSTRLNSSHVK